MPLILLLVVSLFYSSSSDMKIIRENGKVGLADADGKMIIPIVYDELGWSSGEFSPTGDVIGFQENGLWGLITISNKKISKAKYTSLTPTKEGKILAGLKGKFSNRILFGILNTNGTAQVGFQYESILPTANLLIVAQRINSRTFYGLIDYKERIVIPIKYKNIALVNNQLFAIKDLSSKTALFNRQGQSLTPFLIDQFEPQSQSIYRFSSDGHQGLFNIEGKIILPAEYKSVTLTSDVVAMAKEYDHWRAYDITKNELFSLQGDTILSIAHDLLLSQSGSRGRLFDTNGQLIDSIFYERLAPLDSNLLLVRKQGLYGVKDVSGVKMLDLAYDTVIYSNPFFYTRSGKGWNIFDKFQRQLTRKPLIDLQPGGETLIAAREEKYWGYLDFTGKVSIGYKYDEAQPFVGEHAVVKYLGGYGIINTFGNWVVSPYHHKVEIIKPNLFLITNNRGFKQLRNHRNEHLFETYNSIVSHPIGLVEKDSKGKLGLIDPTGRSKLKLEYDSISDVLSDKYVILIRDGYYSLVTLDGKIIIPDYSQFEKIFPFTQDFIGMQKDGKHGYFDLDGRLRIANQYEMVGIWQEDRGPVMLKGKWGFVNSQERLVIQPYYDEVSPFEKGISIARRGAKYGLLDKQGTEVVSFENDLITRLPSGNYLITKDNKLGLATITGRQTLGTIYNYLEELAPDLYHVRRRGKSGVKDDKNVDVLPLSYENITYDPINKIVFSKTAGAAQSIQLR